MVPQKVTEQRQPTHTHLELERLNLKLCKNMLIQL